MGEKFCRISVCENETGERCQKIISFDLYNKKKKKKKENVEFWFVKRPSRM